MAWHGRQWIFAKSVCGHSAQAVSNQDLAGALWLLNAMALVLLLARTQTILDVWLAVTLLMALPDYSLAFFYSALRFSLGWYTARSYALIASFTVLVVLLVGKNEPMRDLPTRSPCSGASAPIGH